jgi:signal transduction histidine kinase
METYFAPPERKSMEQIRESSERIANDHLALAMLNGFGGIVMILNEQRQLLTVNSNLLKMLQLTDKDSLLGLRPGEAIDCVHSADCINGCGTGIYCRNCGAVKCVMEVLKTNRASEGECLLNLGPDGAISMEFAIRAFPIDICDEHLIVVLLRDISTEKFNEAIEQTFFHDIMNTIQGMAGYANLFEFSQPVEYPELAQKIKLLSERLTEEVNFQRMVRKATSDEHDVPLQEVNMAEIASKLYKSYGEYWETQGRFLEIMPISKNLLVKSDPILIYRILTNMIKNAMEAIQKNDKVEVSCKTKDGSIVWEVWNQGVIPKDTASRIFQRFFSTKGSRGRGLGTYSMKLFGEHYLGGKIDFTTSEEEGTVFSFILPPQTGNKNQSLYS